jgi:hypothetical protein
MWAYSETEIRYGKVIIALANLILRVEKVSLKKQSI